MPSLSIPPSVNSLPETCIKLNIKNLSPFYSPSSLSSIPLPFLSSILLPITSNFDHKSSHPNGFPSSFPILDSHNSRFPILNSHNFPFFPPLSASLPTLISFFLLSLHLHVPTLTVQYNLDFWNFQYRNSTIWVNFFFLKIYVLDSLCHFLIRIGLNFSNG